MKKLLMNVFIIFFLSFIIGHLALIHADYVLPYPSFMPGNKLYRVSEFIDSVKKYWYFGNIGQLKYHMAMSDKKLVEAKTLFEYKQYALAMSAINKSTKQTAWIPKYLESAKKQGVDIKEFNKTVCEQMNIHRVVLRQLQILLPATFSWQEEKKDAVNLPIRGVIDSAMQTRVGVQTQEKCL